MRRYEQVQVLQDLENGDIVLEFTLGNDEKAKNWLLVMKKDAAEEMARQILAPVPNA